MCVSVCMSMYVYGDCVCGVCECVYVWCVSVYVCVVCVSVCVHEHM